MALLLMPRRFQVRFRSRGDNFAQLERACQRRLGGTDAGLWPPLVCRHQLSGHFSATSLTALHISQGSSRGIGVSLHGLQQIARHRYDRWCKGLARGSSPHREIRMRAEGAACARSAMHLPRGMPGRVIVEQNERSGCAVQCLGGELPRPRPQHIRDTFETSGC